MVLTLLLIPPQETNAQDINEAVTIEDLGFTLRMSTGARAAAMAGTYTSAGDDAQALVYNPAGLARMRRIELAVGFQHQRTDLDSEYYGSPTSVQVRTTTLDHLSWAYPVPTYRGSFVIAASVNRIYASEIDILNRGFNTSSQTDDDYRLQQSGSVYAYNLGFGIDLAPVLSVGVSGFFADGTINALTQFSFLERPPFAPGDPTEFALDDDARVDVDGYGAILGVQYNPVPILHFGLSVSTPTLFNLAGDAIQQTAEYFFNAPDSFTTEAFAIDTDYQIPFRIDGGISLSTNSFLIAADVGYSDWTQAKINGFQLKDSNLQPVFREVVDYRVAAEVAIPRIPLHVRGGYAYLPYALPYLQADRIAGDAIEKVSETTDAYWRGPSQSPARQMVTGGIGLLLGKALIVDLALQYGMGERSIPTLVDKRETIRFVMSGSYKF